MEDDAENADAEKPASCGGIQSEANRRSPWSEKDNYIAIAELTY
jgi:hypothetical protein